MNAPYLAGKRQLDRRSFLRASGVTLALPLLEAMTPAFSRAGTIASPSRMVCVMTNMGVTPPALKLNPRAVEVLSGWENVALPI